MRRKPLRRPGVALALRRRPRLRRILVAAVAVLCGAAVTTTVQGADDARRSWGRRGPVLVATEDLHAGDRLGPANTRLVVQPAPVVPPGALTSLPEGGRVAQPVFDGEVVRRERLAPSGASALAARLPTGTRAVAIPVEPGTTPPVAVGDLVEVLVALAPEAAGTGAPGFALATGVPVVDVTDAAVTIAVDRDVAPRLAVAFGQGAVTLAVVGP
jgi:Flp pilus assembly protein CpaB